MKNANIKVWVLTGDKVETATSIAISSGLKNRLNDLYFMREIVDRNECQEKIDYLQKNINRTTLIIDGKTLDTVF